MTHVRDTNHRPPGLRDLARHFAPWTHIPVQKGARMGGAAGCTGRQEGVHPDGKPRPDWGPDPEERPQQRWPRPLGPTPWDPAARSLRLVDFDQADW